MWELLFYTSLFRMLYLNKKREELGPVWIYAKSHRLLKWFIPLHVGVTMSKKSKTSSVANSFEKSPLKQTTGGQLSPLSDVSTPRISFNSKKNKDFIVYPEIHEVQEVILTTPEDLP